MAQKINRLHESLNSAVVMATTENKSILKNAGLYLDEFEKTTDADLIIVAEASDQQIIKKAMDKADELLCAFDKSSNDSVDFLPKSLEGAIEQMPQANLALISVAGKYATSEAKKALANGLNVMLFSDNVSLEDEIELKKIGAKKGLLVMGPDCGTAIINGVPLAFANVVNRGNIGVVAASGTGLQSVTTLISNNGGGISQAVGTGGRDIKEQVGGTTFLQALAMLKSDPNTEVILLVSKPPHPSVLDKIGALVKTIDKKVVALFLGASSEQVESLGMIAADTLEEAAYLALEHCGKFSEAALCDFKANKLAEFEGLQQTVIQLSRQLKPQQKYLRALFSGGTYSYEAQLLASSYLPDLYSAAPVEGVNKLKDVHRSEKHTIIDLGEDEFTAGRPHPMIDFSLRNQRIIQEAQDPSVAVILLDLVLGHGANLSPLDELVPTIEKAQDLCKQQSRLLPIICSVTGTDNDPQIKAQVVTALTKLQVVVAPSNAKALKLALSVLKGGK